MSKCKECDDVGGYTCTPHVCGTVPPKTDALDTELKKKILEMVIDGECDVCDKSTRPKQVAEWIAFIQTHYLSREAVREAIPAPKTEEQLDRAFGESNGSWNAYRGYNQAIADFKQALGLEGGE